MIQSAFRDILGGNESIARKYVIHIVSFLSFDKNYFVYGDRTAVVTTQIR